MDSAPLILLVDDEEDLCTLMSMTLSRMGMHTHVAHKVSEAKVLLSKNNYDACLTDFNLPDGNGVELVEHISKNYPNIPIAVLTAYGNMDLAISALKAGAFDFVNKPIKQQHLQQLLDKALNKPLASTESNNENLLEYKMLIGQSAPIQQLRSTIKKIARSQAPVFITGESGTGKEVVANLVHRLSNRNEGPFIAINCGAIPSDLMESELFGHMKGSFTGAVKDRAGKFEQADGGTLFLDEIGDMSLSAQTKVLRALQENEITRVGSDKTIKVNVRVIAATNKNLKQEIEKGNFREDLYHRLNVIPIHVPDLKDRKDDIPLLVDHFIQLICTEQGWKNKAISEEAITALQQHHWPGNIRELRNVVERLIILSGDVITPEDVNLYV